MEEWREIPGFPDYEASSLGRIRSKDRLVPIARPGGSVYLRPLRGRVLQTWLAGSGSEYEYVSLGKDFKGSVHRLVALAFLGDPPSDKHEAAHINGVPRDNQPANLRWATRFENERDKLEHGTYFGRASMPGEAHHKAKLTNTDVQSIRAALTGVRGELTALADRYGVTRGTIARIRDGKGWTHL